MDLLAPLEWSLYFGEWEYIDVACMGTASDRFLLGYRMGNPFYCSKRVEFPGPVTSFYFKGCLKYLRPEELSEDGFFFYHGRARTEPSENEGAPVGADRCVPGVDALCPAP